MPPLRKTPVALVFFFLAASLASADEATTRGPLSWRDDWLLGARRLSLPSTLADTRAPRATVVRVVSGWGSDFGCEGCRGRSTPDQLLFLVDGEHRSLQLEVERGLTASLTASARLPLLWRGGGVLDPVIDRFHSLFGFPDNGRGRYPRDRLVVDGRHHDGRPLGWTGEPGTGLGSAEVGMKWRFHRGDEGRTALALAAVARLPTATGPFHAPGVEGGLQLLARRSLGERWDVHAGAGATFGGPGVDEGVPCTTVRGQGFVAFEWRPWRTLGFGADLSAAGRQVKDVPDYPGLTGVLRLGAKWQAARGWVVEGGFAEGIKGVQGTTDIQFVLGVSRATSW